MVKIVPKNIEVYAVCGSHRARDKLLRIIGQNIQSYHLAFTVSDMSHRGIYPLTKEQIEICKRIKGIRFLPKKKEVDLSPCWSFES